MLWKPVLPTVLDARLDRAGTALALGLAAAAAALVVWGSGLPSTRGDQGGEYTSEAGAAATVVGGDRR